MVRTLLVWIHDEVMRLGAKEVQVIYLAELDRIGEERTRLLKNYVTDWSRYGESWLEKYLDFHMAVYLRAGFDTKEDCIDWLKNNTEERRPFVRSCVLRI